MNNCQNSAFLSGFNISLYPSALVCNCSFINDQGLPGLNGYFVNGRSGAMGDKGDAGMFTPGAKGLKGEQGPRGAIGPDADQKCKIP